MTLTVETGSIVSGANTYISNADFTTYCSDRGITISGDADILLIKSMLYIEQLAFKGQKQTKAQALQWPRYYVEIDGFSIDSDEIPQQLIDLQCEIAIAIGEGDDPLSTMERGVKREKVGEIEREYMDNAAPFSMNRKVKALERKLTKAGGGRMVVRI